MNSILAPTNDRPWRAFAAAAVIVWYVDLIKSGLARREHVDRTLRTLNRRLADLEAWAAEKVTDG